MVTEVIESTTEVLAESPMRPEPQTLFPNAVLWILASPDSAEVMSLSPYRSDDEPGDEVAVLVGPGYLYGHSIRGAAQVPTPARRHTLAEAMITANRKGNGWSLCFDPHYAIRVSRSGRAADFLICFRCGNVRVIVPGVGAVTYPLDGSAARPLRRELRRGGVGWLWFWRRWLL